MEKFIIFGFIAIILLLLLILILNNFGMLSSLNNLIPQTPDISCRVDSDCKMLIDLEWSCNSCGSCKTYDVNSIDVIAINKEWKPLCPFKEIQAACLACVSEIENYDLISIKCINNKCQKVLS